VTQFSSVTGSSQAFAGDSGGALFYKDGATWELLGLLGAIGTYTSGTTRTASRPAPRVVGNVTLAGSIPDYRNAILTATAIPEPADVAAGAVG